MRVNCHWRPIRYSKYDRGGIREVIGFTLERIYRNRWSGHVRFYTGQDMDGAEVAVNGEIHTFHARGRFGLLYIGERS